jgi:uncharacterized membrane protein (DUF485 family)
MSKFNSRVGLVLFTLYLLLYGGFVYLAAFSPQTLEGTPLAGVNLAIWYGFGLIGSAFVLALVYGFACELKGRGPSPCPLPEGEGFSQRDADAAGDES